jgi:hypothetical protein
MRLEGSLCYSEYCAARFALHPLLCISDPCKTHLSSLLPGLSNSPVSHTPLPPSLYLYLYLYLHL